MKLRVLGCSGSESPTGRSPSFLVGDHVLLEAGSVASTLSLEDQAKIDHVLLSHAHLDHVKDLAFLAENVIHRRDRPVCIHGDAECLSQIRAHLFNDIIWPDFTKVPSEEDPVLKFQPLPNDGLLEIGDLKVETLAVEHPGGCLAFFLRSRNSTLVYSGDTGNTIALWEKARELSNLSGFIVETSFSNEMEELAEVSGHLTPRRLSSGLERLGPVDIPVYVVHIKNSEERKVVSELDALEDPRIRVLEAGTEIDF